jgi:hypothetical protein
MEGTAGPPSSSFSGSFSFSGESCVGSPSGWPSLSCWEGAALSNAAEVTTAITNQIIVVRITVRAPLWRNTQPLKM